MLLRNPLLLNRELVKGLINCPNDNNYDNEKGYWITSNNRPLVIEIMESNTEPQFGQTVRTATREGIDQNETSEFIALQTNHTRSREGIDQSERSAYNYEPTILTETRESIDRSERSVD